ncbi:MAG: hypothetical protein OXC18_22350 [Desulfurellaceae bacterium]|nr:hypothetical protein [Desulfurellaceae bacterium]
MNDRLRGQGASDTEWTTAIKTALCQAGHGLNYLVAASLDRNRVVAGCAGGPDFGEWLFDLVWMFWHGEPQRQLNRICLVVESEWGNRGDIMDDFEKLLVARSDVRLMIFQASNEVEVRKMFDLLEREAQGFEQSQAGDYYLLAGYDCEGSIFLWRELQVER